MLTPPLAPPLAPPAGVDAALAARDQAAASGDDAALLRLHELVLAHCVVPPVIDGARRATLRSADAVSTTWEGWDLTSGRPLLLRCVRPRFRNDPVILRRLASGAPGPLDDLTWHPDGAWPHMRADAPGVPLEDLLPVEDAAHPRLLARSLVAGVCGLKRLHAAGRGGPRNPARWLRVGADQVRFTWMDPFDQPADPPAELAALGRAVAALDPDATHPLGALAAGWAVAPPPSADDAQLLLSHTMRDSLISARHTMRAAAHHGDVHGRAARLRRAILSLESALRPPPLTACLRANADGTSVIIQSDDAGLRGGPVAGHQPHSLPIVWTQETGVDPVTARGVLRAWASRETGDQAERDLRNAALSPPPGHTEALIQWLAGMTRLRRARLLLDRQLRMATNRSAATR